MRVFWSLVFILASALAIAQQVFVSTVATHLQNGPTTSCVITNYTTFSPTNAPITDNQSLLVRCHKMTDIGGFCSMITQMHQQILTFDTSVIGGGTIVSARMDFQPSQVVHSNQSGAGWGGQFRVYTSTQDNALLACENVNEIQAAVGLGSLVVGSWNSITLPNTSINRTGNTIFRIGVFPCAPMPTNPPPGGTAESSGRVTLRFTSELSPRLVITLAGGLRLVIVVTEGT